MTRPRDIWPLGGTAWAGVIGDPVRHSLSPLLHNAAYAALGLDWAFLALEVREGEAGRAIEGAQALGVRGLSVTMPHKEAAYVAADVRSSCAERLEAANTLVFRPGEVYADANDGVALIDDLERAGFSVEGAEVAVIGAGGAARSAVLALAEAGAAEVAVVNRSAARAQRAAALAGRVGRVASAGDLERASLVVHATPLGMAGMGDGEAGIEAAAAFGAWLSAGQLAYDLIYHPPRTPFLEAAAVRGATVRNGAGLLVHIAARQFTLYTGEAAPLEVMWDAARAAGHLGE